MPPPAVFVAGPPVDPELQRAPAIEEGGARIRLRRCLGAHRCAGEVCPFDGKELELAQSGPRMLAARVRAVCENPASSATTSARGGTFNRLLRRKASHCGPRPRHRAGLRPWGGRRHCVTKTDVRLQFQPGAVETGVQLDADAAVVLCQSRLDGAHRIRPEDHAVVECDRTYLAEHRGHQFGIV